MNILSLQPTFIRRLCLVVRKFKFVVSGFFVVDVACVAAFKGLDLAQEHKPTAGRDMKHFAADAHPFRVERKGRVELNLVKRLCGRPERFKDLPWYCMSGM